MQKQRKISNSTQDEPGLINGELLEDYIWSFEHLCNVQQLLEDCLKHLNTATKLVTENR